MTDFKNHNYLLIQLFASVALSLLSACTPEENNPGGNDNPGDKTVHVTSIMLSRTSLYLSVGTEETISVTSVLPENANDKTYTWSSTDNSVATIDQNGKITAKAKGDAVIKATANDGSGVFASCEVGVRNPCPAGAVNLGLSVYWATCNLSESGFVSSPIEYGDYYAWGETETKEIYYWDYYRFRISGNSWDSVKFNKYNTSASYGTVDNKTVLDAEDDVAHVKLGGSWRMPTYAEWTELRENCTWSWTTKNGIYGCLLTSNKNGNSIFLPAAGNRWVSSFYDVGSNGTYWSSSLLTDYPYMACGVNFDSSEVLEYASDRDSGLSVRPVSE